MRKYSAFILIYDTAPQNRVSIAGLISLILIYSHQVTVAVAVVNLRHIWEEL